MCMLFYFAGVKLYLLRPHPPLSSAPPFVFHPAIAEGPLPVAHPKLRFLALGLWPSLFLIPPSPDLLLFALTCIANRYSRASVIIHVSWVQFTAHSR